MDLRHLRMASLVMDPNCLSLCLHKIDKYGYQVLDVEENWNRNAVQMLDQPSTPNDSESFQMLWCIAHARLSQRNCKYATVISQ